MEVHRIDFVNKILAEKIKIPSSNTFPLCQEEEKVTQKTEISKNSLPFFHKILGSDNQNKIFNDSFSQENENMKINKEELKIKDINNHGNYRINKNDHQFDIILKDELPGNTSLTSYSEVKNKKNNYLIDNEINLIIKILDKDVNKKIFFLDNTDYNYYYENNIKVSHHHDNLCELNENNTKLFINNKEQIYKKYFIPKKSGDYKIKILLNCFITNCMYMFSECKKIINIDLSLLNTKNVINMGKMFYHCENLTKIDLSAFKTNNVKNMENMFSGCKNLIYLDLSSFDTENVTDMKEMFSGCRNLTNINLYSFNTENVINMSKMFNKCNNITNLDLSVFNTKNVINMEKMFFHCNNLIKIDLSSFYTENKTNLEGILYYNKNLICGNNLSLLNDHNDINYDDNNDEILESFTVNTLKVNRKFYNKIKNKAYFRKQLFIIEV